MNEENKSKGWIKLYRSIKDSWLWENKPFTQGQAWIDILLSVNYEDRKIRLGQSIIEVKAGSFITSTLKLSERWGWNKTKVMRFLKCLESDSKVYLNVSRKCTTINVVNWAFYQDARTTDEPQLYHSCTTDEPQLYINNKLINKESKKEEKTSLRHSANDGPTYPDDFESFWKIYPKKVGKGDAFKSWKKLKPSRELVAQIIKAVQDNCSKNDQWQRDAGQFIPHPSTWLNQARWLDEIQPGGAKVKKDYPAGLQEELRIFKQQGYYEEEIINWWKRDHQEEWDEWMKNT